MYVNQKVRPPGLSNSEMTTSLYYHGERSELAPLLPSSYKTVLEVGCGEGKFSRNLRAGSQIWGCEPNKLAAKEAKKRLTKVFVAKYESIANKLPNQYFDLVICNDVIEHMPDHDWFFDSIIKKMKPSGVLVGSIPNMRHLRSLYHLVVKKDWQYQNSLTLDRTHLRWFTRKSLLNTLERHGFTVEHFIGINGTQRSLYHVFLFFINLVTLWQHRDIEYLQFAFRVGVGKPPNRSLS
ncbi:MAG: class I SAM-dependent methyltransferase [Bacteroidota bacterium]